MTSVVIVSPGQLGSNPRVVKEATALHDAGADVHVISTKVMAAVEPRDREVLANARWSSERIAFDDRRRWRRERLLQVAASAAHRVLPAAWLSPLAHSAFSRRLTQAAMARKADLYIAHYVAALPAAARAAARHGARFAYDAEDFHPGDLADTPGNRAQTALIRRIEARYLPHAAYVTAASPGIADAYAAEYGIPRPTVIHNVFPKTGAAQARNNAATAPRPSLYWFSQTRGTDRGLELALEAIARARSRPHLHIRGHAQPGFDEAFMAQARRLGCAERVHLLDPAEPSRMVELAAAYDAGFAGETGETQNHKIALSNKLFTYLLAGIPAVLSDIPAHTGFAPELPGAAFLFRNGDADSLAAVLDGLFESPDKLQAAREAAVALGESRFNWESESSRLVEVFRGAA